MLGGEGGGVIINFCYHIYPNVCIIYPFDGHNVLKRTKISTSEKPTILHGGTSDTFKTGTKIRCLNSHSDISVYLQECSNLQPLWSKLFVCIKTHWLFNQLKMELISSNGKTRWYTFWLWWYKRCTVREPMRFETVLCVIVSPVRSTYGGYYGLVVVPPRPRPRPQTLHRSHDNLKNPYRIASIFYM